MHFKQPAEDPARISLDLLENIAIIVDKYDLAAALNTWTLFCLEEWRTPKRADLLRLLAVASAFNRHESFFTYSLKLAWGGPFQEGDLRLKEVSAGLISNRCVGKDHYSSSFKREDLTNLANKVISLT